VLAGVMLYYTELTYTQLSFILRVMDKLKPSKVYFVFVCLSILSIVIQCIACFQTAARRLVIIARYRWRLRSSSQVSLLSTW